MKKQRRTIGPSVQLEVVRMIKEQGLSVRPCQSPGVSIVGLRCLADRNPAAPASTGVDRSL